MKLSIEVILAAVFAGTLGVGGLVRTVYASQPQTQTAIMPQHRSSSQIAQGSAQGSMLPSLSSEKPVAPEKNPPGDIPDTQVFVIYSSTAGGYKLEVPEGWARQTNDKNVSFIEKLDGVKVEISPETTAPTAATVKTKQVAKLEKSDRAVKVVDVKDVKLPGGSAVLVQYALNSAPEPVTGKQVRLENNSYIFFKHGKLATLRLWAPQGADNVDQWQRISRSFRWL